MGRRGGARHASAAAAWSLGLILLASAAFAENLTVATWYPAGDIPRPTAEPSAGTSVLDCAGATVLTLAPGDFLELAGDTTGGSDTADAYDCRPWNESGPEVVYTIDVVADIQLHVRLTPSAADLDLFLLSGCDPTLCVAAHTSEFLADLGPGTWHLVVDGYDGAAGAFDLTLTARAAGVPESVCGTAPLIAGASGGAEVFGNVLDAENLMLADDCASYLEPGGEAWYLLEIPASSEVSVLLTEQAFDGALWLFDTCGAAGACLDFADAGISGMDETLAVRNDTGTSSTLILGVDSFRPISSEAGDSVFDGAFRLVVTTTVANETMSFGRLKSLYR